MISDRRKGDNIPKKAHRPAVGSSDVAPPSPVLSRSTTPKGEPVSKQAPTGGSTSTTPTGGSASGHSPTGGPIPPAVYSQTNCISWLMAQRSPDEPMGTLSFAFVWSLANEFFHQDTSHVRHTTSYGWSIGCSTIQNNQFEFSFQSRPSRTRLSTGKLLAPLFLHGG